MAFIGYGGASISGRARTLLEVQDCINWGWKGITVVNTIFGNWRLFVDYETI